MGIAGAIAGRKKDITTTKQESRIVSQLELSGATAQERQAQDLAFQQLFAFERLAQQAEQPSLEEQRFRELLGEATSGQFSEERRAAARQFALDVTGEEEVALDEQLRLAQIEANRQASILGRGIDDPIIQARLAQERVRQRQGLEARRTAIAAEQPFRALGIAQQGLGVTQGLQQQALANRQALLGLGANFAQQLFQQRAVQGRQVTVRSGTGTQTSGGGTKGGVAGFFGGAKAGLGIVKGIVGLAGGGAAGAAGG